MSKDYHGEIAKFSELVWFRILAKQPKLAEQWKEAHWVGKSERSDEHLLAVRGSTYSARAIRRKPREERWNLRSVTAVLVSPCVQSLTRHSQDRSTSRIICWTSMDERRFAPDAHGVQDHIRPSAERGSRQFVPKNLLKQKLHELLTPYQGDQM